jgi:hypothetical protein
MTRAQSERNSKMTHRNLPRFRGIPNSHSPRPALSEPGYRTTPMSNNTETSRETSTILANPATHLVDTAVIEPDDADGIDPDDQPALTECEYCQEPGEKSITRHGLLPAETLPDGSRMHRIVHLVSAEPSLKFIPCRKSTVKTSVGRYSWSGNYENTAPAEI